MLVFRHNNSEKSRGIWLNYYVKLERHFLRLVCTPTCPTHHVSTSQEWPCLYSRGERDSHYGVCRWCTDYIAPEFFSLVIVMAMKRGCFSKAVQWQTMRRWVYGSRAFIVSSDRFSQFSVLRRDLGMYFSGFLDIHESIVNDLWRVLSSPDNACFMSQLSQWVMSQWDSQSI